MTRDSWDWSFASFAVDEPEDDGPPEPESRGTSGALEEHLAKLRTARTPQERQAAAAEALRFLNESRRRERADAQRSLGDESGPTLVDGHPRADVLHPDFLSASSSAPTPRP